MQIQAPCATCINQNPPECTIGIGQVSDSGLVFVTCPKGHSSAITFDERKYMILMRSGCGALLNHHTQESVSSIASALERSYEFFIHASLHRHGVTPELSLNSWRRIEKQSERQFGAFVVLFSIEAKRAFDLSNKIPEFRNRVVHQGYIPTEEEVLRFGRLVYFAIRDIEQVLELMGGEHSDAVQKRSIALQETEIPTKMDHAKLHAFGVRVDASNTVVGRVETFDELLHLLSKPWGQTKT